LPAHSPPLLIRPSTANDCAAMAAIYAAHVRTGTGTFELEAPDAAAFGQRRDDVVTKGWPWLVAEVDGQVSGYAYASPFRPRPAYRFCLEDSIYVDQRCTGRGLGRLLLAELLAVCEARGARQMLAVIGDSNNAASIALHRSLGFAPVGVMQTVGWKLGRWLDVVMMQRALGLGAAFPASEP
jgi:L-amino acid N-acyltransferase YncA